MIVRRVRDGIQLITQPAHAALAHRIMARSAPLAAAPRRDLILEAIASHDDGWAEEDAAPTCNPSTGQVVDFINAPIHVRHRVWVRAVTALATSPWVAALVAQHALTIYQRFRADRAWAAFFAEITARRDDVLRASVLTIDDLARDYLWVELGDLISLVFCTDDAGEHRVGGLSVRLSGARVSVSPDIFGGVPVACEIDALEVRAQSFGSDAELRDALGRADRTRLTGEVRGS